MHQVCFSKPVAGIAAGEPVRVAPETEPILRQAARMGLTPLPFRAAWDQGTTKFRRAGGKTRGYCPVVD